MDIFAHFIISYIIAIFSGLDIFYFVLGGVILDIDHFFGYVYKMLETKNEQSFVKGIFYFPRTFLHSLFGSVFFCLILYLILFLIKKDHLNLILFSFFAGTILHLFLDSFDVLGIKWVYPYLHISGRLPVGYLPGENNGERGEYKKVSIKKFHFNSFVISLIITLLALIIIYVF